MVESFEGLNEHDGSRRGNWAGEVRWFQRALFARVKGDPRTAHMRVFGPALAQPANAGPVGDRSAVLDYGAIHPYPDGREPLANLQYHMTRARAISAHKRFVATETGYHNALGWAFGHLPVTERAMARYSLRLPFEYLAAGIPRSFLYELIDQGAGLTSREESFGLLRQNGAEKPAFQALRNLIALLDDPGPAFAPGGLAYSLRGQPAGISHMLFRPAGRPLLPGALALGAQLRPAPPVGPRDRRPDGDDRLPRARQVRVISPLQSTAPYLALGGVASATLPVPDHPILVEITP